MVHELELIDRLRNKADLCRNDGANDTAKLLDDAACAVDYFSANHFARPPAWVPCRIKLDTPITGDFPFGPETRAEEGEHDCDSNQWGAMSVRASNGQRLGVMPNECQIIGWRRNEKA